MYAIRSYYAERRERIEHIVGRQRAVHAVLQKPVRRGDPAHDVLQLLTAHQVEVGRR